MASLCRNSIREPYLHFGQLLSVHQSFNSASPKCNRQCSPEYTSARNMQTPHVLCSSGTVTRLRQLDAQKVAVCISARRTGSECEQGLQILYPNRSLACIGIHVKATKTEQEQGIGNKVTYLHE